MTIFAGFRFGCHESQAGGQRIRASGRCGANRNLADHRGVVVNEVQLALERALRRWQRVDGNPEAYLRRTLYHLAVDRWRWRTRHPEVDLAADLNPSGRDLAAEVDLRDALVRALASLSAMQRAVLVLRYFEQLTEAEIASTLGSSPGAVKSAASRGLQRLRVVAA